MTAPFKVRAIYEYSSPHEDDLNFPIGQVITVTEEEDDDWYSGEYVDDSGTQHDGIFPRNFVEKFEPTAPPRPTRTRSKKEPERAEEEIMSPPSPVPAPAPAPPVPEVPSPAKEVEAEMEEIDQPTQKTVADRPLPPVLPPAASQVTPSPPAAKPKEAHAADATSSSTPKAKPSAPPPVTEKSASFRDRIAAFNKPAAPPVAPFKPGGTTGFIKKPFVAPPPSRNAYVPPPKETHATSAYRRDEDPEIKEREAENLEHAERAGLVPTEDQSAGEGEDQPKPTSLKERIALLQKQQMEQAQRHAEAATKKEKPKKPAPMKRVDTHSSEAAGDVADALPSPTMERTETSETVRTSTDEARHARGPLPLRHKSYRAHPESVPDGNEADMSGAGDTTEGQYDTEDRDDGDELARRTIRTSSPAKQREEEVEGQEEDQEEEEEEEEEEVDPEVRRKAELRARMAKMSGGMGFHGMFGAPSPLGPPPPKKKATKEAASSNDAEPTSPVSRPAPPIPTPMAMGLPGMGPRGLEAQGSDNIALSPAAGPPVVPSSSGPEEGSENDDDSTTPALASEPKGMPRQQATKADADLVEPRRESAAPPLPGGWPTPPPVPSEARPPPPPPPAELHPASDGSESDDELSGTAGARDRSSATFSSATRSPPMAPHPSSPGLPGRSPSSPHPDESSASSPPSANRRNSRHPPPIPGATPVPPPAQSRPVPPPPPRRQSTADAPMAPPVPTRPPLADEDEEEEITEYEGDYDTDIASSVPHKDALKSHAREASLLDDGTLHSPVAEAPPNQPPPVPSAMAPRAVPPPIPSQPPPESGRRGPKDAPRAAPPPPPPPPTKEAPTHAGDDDGANWPLSVSIPAGTSHEHKASGMEEEGYTAGVSAALSPLGPKAAAGTPRGRQQKQSMDVPRTSTSNRRSADLLRPSMESGFIANDVDLAVQSEWWKQPNQVPPALQGRKDIRVESEESTTTNQGAKAVVSLEFFILFQDYSQTIITVRYDPYNTADVEVEQRHEPPPRALRQDQMEEYHDRFGRQISQLASAKKDTVVADGTPQGLVLELLRPHGDALWPVGTRSYGALVYANMANASTQQHDVIRPGDIITIRNAKFQGKHGPMHAKYSAEVGKPDHVAIVAEWDGTKKKVRAWEQGRESKKVKMESFKLDDLRSGEVKIWRVVPRSWIGWNSQP
ncbi:hypothetical protein RJ55_04126 [Drechmeria coniospora]|nr:hypothetical protein RJ55_04126 [Drechmeria coniospora]